MIEQSFQLLQPVQCFLYLSECSGTLQVVYDDILELRLFLLRTGPLFLPVSDESCHQISHRTQKNLLSLLLYRHQLYHEMLLQILKVDL